MPGNGFLEGSAVSVRCRRREARERLEIVHAASGNGPGGSRLGQELGPGQRGGRPRGEAGRGSAGPALTGAVPSGGTKQRGVGGPSPCTAASTWQGCHRGQTPLPTRRKHQPRRRGLGAGSPEPAEGSGRPGAWGCGPGPAPGMERQAAVRLPEKGARRLTRPRSLPEQSTGSTKRGDSAAPAVRTR